MKNRVLSFLASIALLSLVSCTDEMQELAGEQSQALKQIVMTTQDFQPEAGSRTVYQIADGAVKCTWATNDTVGVFPDKGIQTCFPMTSGAGTKNATFDGGGWALKDGSTYGAYYPFISEIFLDKNAVPVSYTGQKQVGNGSMAHLGDCDYMVATPTAPEFGSAQFMFKHLSALVQLKVTIPEPATFTSVKLVTDTKAFAVEGKVDVMADAPVITPTAPATEVVLNLQNVVTTKENEVVTFYLMLPPADLSGKTLKAVLVSDKGNVEVDLESKNFKAGTAYALSGAWEIENPIGDGSYKDGVVSLAKAGSMRNLLGNDYMNITSLKVVGPINGNDVYYLRKMLGATSFNEEDRGKLTTLDLSKASFVEGGEWYYEYSTSSHYYTSNDAIGDYMFFECANLQNIILPDGVASIGFNAFKGCNALTFITIGNSVTSIGSSAFSACKALSTVTIGDGVASIGSGAFSGCASLKSVYITDLFAWCKIKFEDNSSNPLWYYSGKLYLNNQELTELVIPEGITEIKNDAFSRCSSLISVDIPDGVTSIGSWAFSGCEALTTVTIGDGVASIGSYAFNACSSLSSVTIGDGVTSIGHCAFHYCTSLTSIDIPDSVTTIGISAFYGCTSLTSLTIGNGVSSIGASAFNGCSSLTSATIGDGVTSIGDFVFYNCSSLSSIIIPEGVTSIGDKVFYGCSSLTSINIPDGVTSIGISAFEGCSSLTSVTIGDSVTSIGRAAFNNCSSLKDFYCCAITPPVIKHYYYGYYYSFPDSGYDEKTTLYVPARCGTKYKSSDWGRFFKTVKEM